MHHVSTAYEGGLLVTFITENLNWSQSDSVQFWAIV